MSKEQQPKLGHSSLGSFYLGSCSTPVDLDIAHQDHSFCAIQEEGDKDQASLDDWGVVQPLMEGCIILNIIERILKMDDQERKKKNFAIFLELDTTFLANVEVVNLHKVEASKAMEVAKEYKAEVEHLKETHSTKVGHLQVVLKREEQASAELKAALALKKERRKKTRIRLLLMIGESSNP
ncbi:hypothetical protein COCNU_12G000010 [Cocos nucifera]|uniref:Uncharacterized protein n=1 Tax=Cocos nucifera TaxID=13894 RepID=A0A8K0NA84_COCNU|nr:hypothetical protein COCNU_12G000010 [Cocos nucifera]